MLGGRLAALAYCIIKVSAIAAKWRHDMYRKSSHSTANGDCVETGSFRKSTYSAAGNCIEAGHGAASVGVRDTKEEHLGDARTVLEFTPSAWAAFTRGLKAA
jgi:Domain of unknown function (DUF397)